MADDSGGGRYTEIASLLVLGVTFGALFLNVDNWWLGFVLGYGVVVPLVSLLTGEEVESEDEPDETDQRMDDALDGRGRVEDAPPSKRDAMETLRDRYARGELSEEQFERKLEHLLETETLEDARETVERSRRERDDRERDERERELDYE
ncbi:SHOCT domain-containing protein [Halorubellus sp. PRR65]|uniref:SHOCT domain-containing protein n=1 Tax=Halorubellus sp. PRR65 TaxID=3098148 RepID=UPI002B25AD94|nr:SHOCT domain-containing protein [Halorubellus sp. PRR65]